MAMDFILFFVNLFRDYRYIEYICYIDVHIYSNLAAPLNS